MITVLKAPPLATIQDLGFPSGRAWGLPRSGAMDPRLLAMANALVGNPPGAGAIEWASGLGGGPGVFRCEVEVRIAVLGLAELRLDDRAVDPPALMLTVGAGATLSIAPRANGRVEHAFSYLAVAGGFAVPTILGSRSTYLPGGFGGHTGRRLQAGDRLAIGPAVSGLTGGVGTELRVTEVLPAGPAAEVTLRVTRGPQWTHFDGDARATFFSSRFTVSPASDRMGYRLAGPVIRPLGPATLPSEAACPGAVQIPDGGQPIVLMPDGPTVGGYPKLAVVIRADLRRLGQCLPERGIRFQEVSLSEARACYSLTA